MKIFGSVLYMYAIAAVISFFVAFLIKLIFIAISTFEKQKNVYLDEFKVPGGMEINSVQKEAEQLDKEKMLHAVIGLALHLYDQEIHETDSMKMTIQKTMKYYSPWSSKIYGLNQWRR